LFPAGIGPNHGFKNGPAHVYTNGVPGKADQLFVILIWYDVAFVHRQAKSYCVFVFPVVGFTVNVEHVGGPTLIFLHVLLHESPGVPLLAP